MKSHNDVISLDGMACVDGRAPLFGGLCSVGRRGVVHWIREECFVVHTYVECVWKCIYMT